MRFLVAVFDNRSESATAEEMASIDALNGRLREDKHFIMAAGLADPKTTVTFDVRDEGAVSDSLRDVSRESSDFMSGFWILDAPSPEVAQSLARDAAEACRRRVELRRILG